MFTIETMPLSVAQEVTRRADNQLQQVLSITLDKLSVLSQQAKAREEYGINEDWHRLHTITGPYAQGCGCVYCQALARYVQVKVLAHRVRSRLDRWDYVYDADEDKRATQQLEQLTEEWQKLRTAKNQIRLRAGL